MKKSIRIRICDLMRMVEDIVQECEHAAINEGILLDPADVGAAEQLKLATRKYLEELDAISRT